MIGNFEPSAAVVYGESGRREQEYGTVSADELARPIFRLVLGIGPHHVDGHHLERLQSSGGAVEQSKVQSCPPAVRSGERGRSQSQCAPIVLEFHQRRHRIGFVHSVIQESGPSTGRCQSHQYQHERRSRSAPIDRR